MAAIQHHHKHRIVVEPKLYCGNWSAFFDGPQALKSVVTSEFGAAFHGAGACHPHFGEILQGAFEIPTDEGPRIERGLVSVSVPTELGSVAHFTLDAHPVGDFAPASGRHGIIVTPSHYEKCAKAARLTLDEFGLRGVGGILKVTTHVCEGTGMGSSTTGVVATIRAVTESVRAYRGGGQILAGPHVQARIAVAAERACDSIMFDSANTAVLFAHRKGRVLKTFNGPLPRMKILGFDTADARGVDTDTLPRARYSPQQISAFRCAVATLERAIEEQSVDLVGRVATFSAKVSEAALANPLCKPKFGELLKIKSEVGSAGIVVAHSGTVAGLIFDPTDPHHGARIQKANTALDRLDFGCRRLFTTPY